MEHWIKAAALAAGITMAGNAGAGEERWSARNWDDSWRSDRGMGACSTHRGRCLSWGKWIEEGGDPDEYAGGPERDLISAQGEQGKVLDGGEGEDFIIGSSYGDKIYGGDGDDKMLGCSPGDCYGGYEPGKHGWLHQRDVGAIDPRNDNDEMHGGNGNDWMDGRVGDDFMDGQAGNDYMLGGHGNDTMYGGTGRDKMHGQKNQDTLIGGKGKDKMWGGRGGDRFVFDSESGRDKVMDFQRERDKLVFRGYEFADLTIKQGKKGAVITGPNDDWRVMLKGVKAKRLTEAHFEFIPDPPQ